MLPPSIETSACSEEQVDAPKLLELFASLVRIRTVEERIKEEYATRRIRGPVHLSIGQEAIAVGVLRACRATDRCVSTHRNHAHYLAKGGSLAGMVDELYGLASGCCKGYGGSMHFMDAQAGLLLSSAIVAGSVPIAAGVAFALKREGAGDLCIAFTGDGGTDEGVFYETLNLAALLQLPVLFVVENNGVSTLTPYANRQAAPHILAKAASFGVEGTTVNGNDMVEVYRAARSLMARVRQAQKPLLLEAVTERLCAHVGPISYVGGIGADEELVARLDREPLQQARALLQHRLPQGAEQCATIEREVHEEVDRVFQDAIRRFDQQVAQVQLPPPPPPPDPRRV